MDDPPTEEGRWAGRLRRWRKRRRERKMTKEDAISGAIGRVLFPVMICMALSVYLFHSVGDDSRRCSGRRDGREGFRDILSNSANARTTSDGNFPRVGAFIFVGIFVGCMVLFTFIIVCLYKFHCEKLIRVWLMLAVLLIFGYVGGLYLFSWSKSRCLALDWITFVVIVWNFSVVGLVAIFWKAPRIINQAYLIAMSALMAFIFRTLPEWATWIILGALVLWDLFAVLAPCGPLKMLVDTARERGDPLPALVYDTNPASVGRDPSAEAGVVRPKRKKRNNRKDKESATEDNEQTDTVIDPERGEASTTPTDANEPDASTAERSRRTRHSSRGAPVATEERSRTQTNARGGAENYEEVKVGTLGAHLKLGLGDFVFYSVLVAQASEAGAMTAATSFIAILFGLCATLFLVVVYQRALPALPISIALGLLFFFLTKFTLQPFVANILPELLLH